MPAMVTVEDFNALTQTEQVERLQTLGEVALAEFGVVPERIEPLVHAENTTYHVLSEAGEFNLRISRPGYQSSANIDSEIAFLSALRAEGFRVPGSVPRSTGSRFRSGGAGDARLRAVSVDGRRVSQRAHGGTSPSGRGHDGPPPGFCSELASPGRLYKTAPLRMGVRASRIRTSSTNLSPASRKPTARS